MRQSQSKSKRPKPLTQQYVILLHHQNHCKFSVSNQCFDFLKKLFHPILLVKTCTGKLLRWYWHVKVKWLKILEVIYNQEYPFFSNHSIMLRKVNFFIRLRLFLLKPYVSIDFFHKFFSWMIFLHLFMKHCLNCLFMADCTKT